MRRNSQERERADGRFERAGDSVRRGRRARARWKSWTGVFGGVAGRDSRTVRARWESRTSREWWTGVFGGVAERDSRTVRARWESRTSRHSRRRGKGFPTRTCEMGITHERATPAGQASSDDRTPAANDKGRGRRAGGERAAPQGMPPAEVRSLLASVAGQKYCIMGGAGILPARAQNSVRAGCPHHPAHDANSVSRYASAARCTAHRLRRFTQPAMPRPRRPSTAAAGTGIRSRTSWWFPENAPSVYVSQSRITRTFPR